MSPNPAPATMAATTTPPGGPATPGAGLTPLLLTDVEAAAVCGLSRGGWRGLVRDGRAPRPVKLGRATRWRLEELRAWTRAGSPPCYRWTWRAGEGGAA